jgi:hypothetical protein
MIGGGIIASVTTSCNKGSIGLEFSNLKATVGSSDDGGIAFLLTGNVSGLENEDWSCTLCTTTDNRQPSPKDDPTNLWALIEDEETEGLAFST